MGVAFCEGRPLLQPRLALRRVRVTRAGLYHFALRSATIPNAILQVIVNIVDSKMSLRGAVECPRIHHQYQPDRVDAEPAALVFDVGAKLETRGHKLNPKLRSQGDVHAVMIEEGTGWRLGWSDGRRGGRAIGY
jgi:gamma-glutamyltranspeptidase/glutathione hydrolase